MALRKRICQSFDFELQAAATDDGVLLSLGPQHSFPLESVFRMVHPSGLDQLLTDAALQAPMNLGILPLAAALHPRRFVHIVFDNEVYGSTGSQRSITTEIRLDRMAEAAGYRTVAAVTEADEITEAVRTALDSDGPHFILAKVTAEEAEVPRIPYTPHQLRDRFRASVRA